MKDILLIGPYIILKLVGQTDHTGLISGEGNMNMNEEWLGIVSLSNT
jgi:hypothetical protein